MGNHYYLNKKNSINNDKLVQVHVLPQEMIGRSTFGISMYLLKWFPVRLVDKFLLLMSWLLVGDTSQIGLHRPEIGPLELKNLSGKTPVIDVGTLAKIRSGHIKVPFTVLISRAFLVTLLFIMESFDFFFIFLIYQ